MTLVERYLDRIRDLQRLRVVAGGDLSDAEEDRFGDELDVYWNKMTDEEHVTVGRLLADEVVS